MLRDTDLWVPNLFIADCFYAILYNLIMISSRRKKTFTPYVQKTDFATDYVKFYDSKKACKVLHDAYNSYVINAEKNFGNSCEIQEVTIMRCPIL